ncbi:MAG: hypothetical protein ACOYKA_02825 [Legionellaceae bacterium]
MQTTYERNLEIAQGICSEIKQETVCSNDIIPRQDMPVLAGYMLSDLSARFGRTRITSYLGYTGASKKIREMIMPEAQRLGMISPVSSAVLAMAHFGAGEAHELATLALQKLMAHDRHDVAFVVIHGPRDHIAEHPEPYLHAFILLGIDSTFNLKSGDGIEKLNRLPRQVVVLDPLLHHVGQARTYFRDQSAYMRVFGHYKINLVDVVGAEHLAHRDIIKDNVRRLIAYGESQGLKVYDRTLCELPLANFPAQKRQPCAELPRSVSLLNERSGLHFDAVEDEQHAVDAVTELSSPEQEALAQRIQSEVKGGCFYRSESRSRNRFFVLHQTDHVGSPEPTPLSRRIQTRYEG